MTTFDEATYTAFTLVVDGERAITLNADASACVNWGVLEHYTRLHSIDMDQAGEKDFIGRCIARLLLALRDGRVTDAGYAR